MLYYLWIGRRLMNKTLVVFAGAIVLALGMAACSQTTTDHASDAAKSAGEAVKGAAHDASEAVEDAAKKVKESVSDTK